MVWIIFRNYLVCGIDFSLIWAPKAIIDGCETCGNIIKQQDTADQIEKLYKLQKRGIITKKEFDAEKKKILSK